MHEFLYLIKSVGLLTVVILLANYLLKYLNRYQQQRQQHIQIIEKVSVSKDSSLLLVKVLDTYYLMSASGQKNELLQELSEVEQARLRNQANLLQEKHQQSAAKQRLNWQKKVNHFKVALEKRRPK